MTLQERTELNIVMAGVLELQRRVDALEREVEDWRKAAEPTSLADAIIEAAKYNRFVALYHSRERDGQ